ncbi:Tim44-like domain protein [Ancylostoma duodenale]|uniref:Tim44-like domain protein n=1 Tax=Ancylostoma duodenale TaxID=51022 RepID=A0A0C2GI17_9BILA|nr:Tim44-like domain protein [Ancylostoma duodenale]
MIKEVQKTEAGKKMTAAGTEALKQARLAAEHVEKIAEKVGDTEVYKQVSTEIVEKETLTSSEVVKAKLEELSEQLTKMIKEVQKTEAGKKMTAAGTEALKQARLAAEHVEKIAEKVGDTEVYKQVSTSMKTVKDEIDTITDVRMYSRPGIEATGVTLHKESKWYAGWKKFSEENAYFNKLLDWKIRYEESDNVAVRLMRGITERLSSVFGSQNEVSEVLTEIAKIDPSFDKAEWLRFCEKEVIPNVLEAFIRGDLEVLQDWCHERAFVALSTVIKEYQKIKFSTADSRIIDISKVEMVSGKMMEQGPVLIITFQAFMINVVKNAEGKVVEGDPNTPVRVHHVWVMCRDMEEYNPAVAWKLLEVHMQEGQLAM